jgi:hypothetical protein
VFATSGYDQCLAELTDAEGVKLARRAADGNAAVALVELDIQHSLPDAWEPQTLASEWYP